MPLYENILQKIPMFSQITFDHIYWKRNTLMGKLSKATMVLDSGTWKVTEEKEGQHLQIFLTLGDK